MKQNEEGNGHNSSSEKLRQFVARIEKLEEEKAATIADIKEVYTEAKSFGLEASVIKIIIRRRKEDEQKRKEKEELIALYEAVIDGRQLDLFKQEESKNENQNEHNDNAQEDQIFDDEDEEGWQDDEDLQD